MIGIGLAEQSGLIGALLKSMVRMTPASMLTPAAVIYSSLYLYPMP